jgi:hypothetical protein
LDNFNSFFLNAKHISIALIIFQFINFYHIIEESGDREYELRTGGYGLRVVSCGLGVAGWEDFRNPQRTTPSLPLIRVGFSGEDLKVSREAFKIPTAPFINNVIKSRGKPFWKRVFPLNPRHRGSLFPKTFKSFGKMAWKKPFFKRVSSKISTRMLNLMTLPFIKGDFRGILSKNEKNPPFPPFTKGGNKKPALVSLPYPT